MRLLVLVALLALAATAAAAAGKDPRKAITAAGQARANRVAIKAGDLPGADWRSRPPTPGRASPRCPSYHPDESRLTEIGDATSRNFVRTDGTYVSSGVAVFASASQGRAAYAALTKAALPRCLGEFIAKSGAPGAITVIAAGSFPFPRYGDRSVAFRVLLSVLSGGKHIPGVIDAIVLHRGAVVAVLLFGATGTTLPTGLEQHVAGRVAMRF